jgi:hypothetical protein
MSFNRTRSIRTTREIKELPDVSRMLWHYSDKRAGNKYRHKIGIDINECRLTEIIQMIQLIIRKNYPESFPILRKVRLNPPPAFVEIVWVAKEVFTNEIFKIVLEDKGCPVESVAG